MTEYAEKLKELIAKARSLHTAEREATINSMLIVGELDRMRAGVWVGMSVEKFAQYIGLTLRILGIRSPSN